MTDCKLCHGKGVIYFGDADGNEHSVPCDCPPHKPVLSSHEETARYYQSAFLRERRERQATERCFVRLINWLRGEDAEFGKQIVDYPKNSHTTKSNCSEQR